MSGVRGNIQPDQIKGWSGDATKALHEDGWKVPSGGGGGGGGGGLVLLEEHVITSSSASMDFTTRNVTGQSGASIQSDYDDYLVRLINIVPATNTQNLRHRVSTDGGSTFDATS